MLLRKGRSIAARIWLAGLCLLSSLAVACGGVDDEIGGGGREASATFHPYDVEFDCGDYFTLSRDLLKGWVVDCRATVTNYTDCELSATFAVLQGGARLASKTETVGPRQSQEIVLDNVDITDNGKAITMNLTPGGVGWDGTQYICPAQSTAATSAL